MGGAAVTFVFSIVAFCVLRFVSDPIVAFILLVLCTGGLAPIGMAEFVKYAAAEACFDDERRSLQVSRVITGGAVIAMIGPFSATTAASLDPGNEIHGYAYFFLIMSVLAFLAIIVASAMKLPSFQVKSGAECVHLCKILTRTGVWTSVVLQSTVQVLMVTPMQATPLAMTDTLGLTAESFWISGCIVAHIRAMFLPGLFTGHLISAVGKI